MADGSGAGSERRTPGAADRAVAAIDDLPPDACIADLAPLFEGAPRFLARLCAARPFSDEAALFAAAHRIALAMPEPEQIELIDAHPRLGAPAASVSALSFAEQGYARQTAAAEAVAQAEAVARAQAEAALVAAELERLNDAYEAHFGFRYCVFVAGRSRAALLPGFAAALTAERSAEIVRAVDAVVDIAADRWSKVADRP